MRTFRVLRVDEYRDPVAEIERTVAAEPTARIGGLEFPESELLVLNLRRFQMTVAGRATRGGDHAAA